MSLEDLVGQRLRAPESYEVSRAKVREFAEAVGESSPLCSDVEAARAAGYPDLVAPVTFAVIPSFEGLREVMTHEFALADYASALSTFRDPESGAIKIIIKP